MYVYRKRAFLNPLSTGKTSYIQAEVESSDEGNYRNGNYLVILADCKGHQVTLEFYIGTAIRRRQSLAKIDLLIEILSAFRDALRHEAQVIEKQP